MLELDDERRLAKIAEEFDGVNRFERKSEEEGDAVYEGYSRLVMIQRKDMTGAVQMTFAKE